MAKWGRVEYKQFKKLQERLEKFEKLDKEKFMEECSKELAARLLAKVIKRTPVRKPEDCPPGVTGGTLRRGWTAGNRSSAKAYVDSLHITKSGNTYEIEIINPVEYASYVEFGHRTRNHKGWVQGRFMLTMSEQEIETAAPKILESKLLKSLGECFDD